MHSYPLAGWTGPDKSLSHKPEVPPVKEILYRGALHGGTTCCASWSSWKQHIDKVELCQTGRKPDSGGPFGRGRAGKAVHGAVSAESVSALITLPVRIWEQKVRNWVWR